MKFKSSTKVRWGALGALMIAGAAYAAIQITINTPIAISDGGNGDKPKVQRGGDGTLVVVYGDSPAGAGDVYDVKADVERKARDVFAKSCKHDATKTCDNPADWSAATNISGSALKSSIKADWRGLGLEDYPGDIDKPNVKTNGSVVVVTWVGKYCPDGDPSTPAVDAPVQRAIQYTVRNGRVIPFSCTWVAWSTNNGVAWRGPTQLSSGLRDAIQDSSNGGFNSTTKKGQVNITWQEDPQGLLLGEGDGPGDGASGAKTNGGTDIWYTWATIDLSVPSTPTDDFKLVMPPVRLTDNWQGKFGPSPDATDGPVIDGAGVAVDTAQLERGEVGASRANVAMVGSTALVAYEEEKGVSVGDTGKFVRYHAFKYDTPDQGAPVDVGGTLYDVGTAGCVLSDPARNARRVRLLTQSPDDAGTGGIQLAIFWREGEANKGGSADIVLRRGIGGVQPANLVPAVDAACEGVASQRAENVSSNTPTATGANLADDTEKNNVENALAHRGVLRGPELWVGYMYTSDLNKLALQQDNYNFWLRKYTLGGTWESARNVTNVTDKAINVREPRIFGTPKSNASACPSGNPADPTTTDKTQCQNTDVVYLAWGTQTNTANPADLGVWITVSLDGGNVFATPVRYSTAMGPLFQDDEAAYESQVVTRPDGTRFYGVWNQADLVAKTTAAEYASGEVTVVPDPPVPPITPPFSSGSSGGCTIATGDVPFDPTLPLLVALGVAGLGLRRVGARRR